MPNATELVFLEHAPRVPIEFGVEYEQKVIGRCPVETGKLVGSLSLLDDGTEAWMNSPVEYGFWVLESGTQKMPASRILSTSAAEVQMTRKEQTKLDDKRAKTQEEKLDEELREDLRKILRVQVQGTRAAPFRAAQLPQIQRTVQRTLRDRLRVLLGIRPPPQATRSIVHARSRRQQIRLLDGLLERFRAGHRVPRG